MAVPGAPGRPLAIPPPLSAGDGPDYRNDVSRLRHRHIAGMRVSALIETVIALSALLLLAPLLGIEDRFASVAPHPFWAVVLVVSVYYGVNEGLAAAAFATLALLAFNMPELAFDDSVADWLLRATTQPVLWFMAAMVLGEIRAGHRRERDALLDRLEEMTRQAHTITEAFDRLNTVKRQLEARVAGQVQTVASFCDAAHAIARPDTAAVLAGSDTFVRGTLGCPSHTLFLLKGRLLLGARTQSGPAALDAIPTLSAGDPLFHAIVDDRRYLTVSDQSAADLLAGQAVMAGPIEDIETGRILGMLRIESMAFEALTPTMIHSFRVVCQELGRALVMAEQVEERVAKAGRSAQETTAVRAAENVEPVILSRSDFGRQVPALCDLAREMRFDVTCLFVAIDATPGTDGAVLDALFAQTAARLFENRSQSFAFGMDGWDYAILLPGCERKVADKRARRLVAGLEADLAAQSIVAVITTTTEPLVRQSKPSRLFSISRNPDVANDRW